jgi:hypothetical protein
VIDAFDGSPIHIVDQSNASWIPSAITRSGPSGGHGLGVSWP